MSDSTTPRPSTPHPQHRKLPLHLPLSFALALAPAGTGTAASIIYSGGQPEVSHYRSDGSDLLPDSGITFEIGIFYGGFEPDANNTDQWLDHWAPMSEPGSGPLPGSSTPFTTIPSLFGDFDGFSSSVDLNHNTAPFTAGTQGFIWGFDQRTELGPAQWLLLTNSAEWLLPNGTSQTTPSQTWTIAGVNTAEMPVGSLDGPSMTFGAVMLTASPVPEPGAAALAGLGLCLLWRRRRPCQQGSPVRL